MGRGMRAKAIACTTCAPVTSPRRRVEGGDILPDGARSPFRHLLDGAPMHTVRSPKRKRCPSCDARCEWIIYNGSKP